MTQRIKVIIRPKPLAQDQIKTLTSIDYVNNIISVNKINQKTTYLPKDNSVRTFAFSKILMPEVSQEEIYQDCGFSLVQNVLEGYNGTIFAYGQTGSGKTFTMMGGKQYLQKNGKRSQNKSINEDTIRQQKKYINELKGIIPRSFNQIITVTKSQKNKKHLIQCSFIEIYNENVHDLLGEDIKSNLSLKQNSHKGLIIQNLKTFLVKSVQQLQQYFKIGYKNRSVRQTNMNKQSSRSHCIFTIKIQEETTDQFGNTKFKVGKLNFVDLAGSQRQNKANINKDEGIKQASKINLSLSALGKVINCLSNYKQNQKIYIPYRESKLTRILQDSLGGNTKTVMIATISQNSLNYEQTLSTLIYASRAKFIQNKPILNQDPKDVLLREYVQQIQKLKSMLKEKQIQNQGLKKTFINFNPINTTSKMTPIIYEQQEQLKLKIQNLQKILGKDESQNQQQKKQLQKIEQLKIKIKFQQQRQKQLEIRNKKRQEELLLINKQYKSLNQEVDNLRYKFKQLKRQYIDKCCQLDDFQKQSNEEKLEFNYIIREKDKQIHKLQTMLQQVLDQKQYRKITDGDQNRSNISSNSHSVNNFNFQVEKKPKINLTDKNLFKHEENIEKSNSSQKQSYNKSKKTSQNSKFKIQMHNSVEKKKNYQSDNGKRSEGQVMIQPKGHSSYTSMKDINNKKDMKIIKGLSQAKEQEKKKKQRTKKIDSLISLKNLKKQNVVKLPFITEIKKLNSSHELQKDRQDNAHKSKIGLDIAKIKNDIINELKYSKNKSN